MNGEAGGRWFSERRRAVAAGVRAAADVALMAVWAQSTSASCDAGSRMRMLLRTAGDVFLMIMMMAVVADVEDVGSSRTRCRRRRDGHLWWERVLCGARVPRYRSREFDGVMVRQDLPGRGRATVVSCYGVTAARIPCWNAALNRSVPAHTVS